jgi:hypothetical protein
MPPRSKPSNAQLLTQGEHYIKNKKKAAKDQVEKVVFDDDARLFVPLSSLLFLCRLRDQREHTLIVFGVGVGCGCVQGVSDRFQQA